MHDTTVNCEKIYLKYFKNDVMDLHVKNKIHKSIQKYIRNENKQYVQKLENNRLP